MIHRIVVSTASAAVVLSACRARAPAPPIEVPRHGRFELTVPTLADVRATFTAPSGRVVEVFGFSCDGASNVRFSPDESGLYAYVVHADGSGTTSPSGRFLSVPSGLSGPVRLDPEGGGRLVRSDGTAFYVLGESLAKAEQAWSPGGLEPREYVTRMAENGVTTLRVEFDLDLAPQLDAIVEEAERQDVYVVMSLAPKREPIEDERRRMRYVLGRYGYSSHLLAIDLSSEPARRGATPEASWSSWAEELAGEWRTRDPYGHFVTVGFFGEPVPYDKDEPSPYDRTHNGMWTAVFSGGGVLREASASFEDERARQFRVLSEFLHGLDPEKSLAPRSDVRASPYGVRAWALGAPDYRALWVLSPRDGYGDPVDGAVVTLGGVIAGSYFVEWRDDESGDALAVEQVRADGGELVLRVPRFVRHVAGKLVPAPPDA